MRSRLTTTRQVADDALYRGTNASGGGGGGGTVPSKYSVVSLTDASSAPTMGAINEVDSSAGAVSLTVPAAQTTGTWFGLKLITDPSVHSVMINAPAGKELEVPSSLAGGVSFTFAASITFDLNPEIGSGFQWYCQSDGNYAFYPE
jgi:hypothetical protein